MPIVLGCVVGAHDREEGVNVHETARIAKLGAQTAVCAPYAGVCVPQPTICTCSNSDHSTWQQCSSDVAATMDKVSLDLPCPRSIRR